MARLVRAIQFRPAHGGSDRISKQRKSESLQLDARISRAMTSCQKNDTGSTSTATRTADGTFTSASQAFR